MLSTRTRASLLRAAPLTRRHFVIAALAALTNSSFVKNIQMADDMEDLTSRPKSNTPLQQPKPTQITSAVNENGIIELSTAERGLLLLVSGIQAFLHPEVGRNINNFGEASSFDFILRQLRDQMLASADGRYLLRHKPLLNQETLPRDYLKGLPANTLGAHYLHFTEGGDARAPVRFIADEELNYVFTRYRQIHDIVHILTGSKIDLAGELPVKAFEFGNTGLPMTGLACFAYFKLSAKRKQKVNMLESFLNGLSSTSLVTVRWEVLMERDVDEIRKELGIISH
jgi:ubiquinone biosynthesis protein COQ4